MCLNLILLLGQKTFVSVGHFAEKVNKVGRNESLEGSKHLPRKRLLNIRETTSEVLVMPFPLAKVSPTAREYR